MNRSCCGGLVLSLAFAVSSPAAADDAARSPRDFHRRARIEGELAPGQAHGVPLGVEAVAAYRSGGELRLFDAQGREIPSLVQPEPSSRKTVERAARIFNRAWKEDGTLTISTELKAVSAELADPAPELVDEFVLKLDADDYHMRARVEGSDDGQDWRILADGLHLIRHRVANEDIEYAHDVLRVPPSRYRSYRFTLVPQATPRGDDASPRSVSELSVRRSAAPGRRQEVPVAIARMDDLRDDEPRHHYWRLELPYAALGVDRVELEIGGGDFARPASLWEWSDDRQRRVRRLASSVVFRFGDDSDTSLEGFATDARTLALRVDQGDDTPVPVARVAATRAQLRLAFIAPETTSLPLTLHVEPDEPQEPRYDLARRLEARSITTFRELSHAALEPNPGYAARPAPRSEQLPFLLYLVVVPFIVGVALYVARTVRRGATNDDPGSPTPD